MKGHSEVKRKLSKTFNDSQVTFFSQGSLSKSKSVVNINGNDKNYIPELTQYLLNINIDQLELLFQQLRTDKRLYAFCQGKQFDKHWRDLWSMFGCLLTGDEKKCFRTNSAVPGFKLLSGVFYFYQFMQKQEKHQHNDWNLLEHAVSSQSIHATQVYNDWLYSNLSGHPSVAEHIYEKIIKNCFVLRETYGSYAYMMLVEAYMNFSIFKLTQNSPHDAEILFKKAMRCCDLAAQYLDLSADSIAIASLFRGLEVSNHYNMSDPIATKAVLQALYAQHLELHSSSNNLFNI